MITAAAKIEFSVNLPHKSVGEQDFSKNLSPFTWSDVMQSIEKQEVTKPDYFPDYLEIITEFREILERQRVERIEGNLLRMLQVIRLRSMRCI